MVSREVAGHVVWKGVELPEAYRLDLLVDGALVIEVKAVEVHLPLHRAQLHSYLRLTGHPIGLLVNFCVPALRDGVYRVVNLRP